MSEETGPEELTPEEYAEVIADKAKDAANDPDETAEWMARAFIKLIHQLEIALVDEVKHVANHPMDAIPDAARMARGLFMEVAPEQYRLFMKVRDYLGPKARPYPNVHAFDPERPPF